MNIKCPDCGTIFEIDDIKLSAITSQIRNSEFDKEVEKRVSSLITDINEKHQLEISAKVSDASLKAKAEIDKIVQQLQAELQTKSETIAKLTSESEKHASDIELAVLKATTDVEKKMELQRIEYEAELRDKQTQL